VFLLKCADLQFPIQQSWREAITRWAARVPRLWIVLDWCDNAIESWTRRTGTWLPYSDDYPNVPHPAHIPYWRDVVQGRSYELAVLARVHPTIEAVIFDMEMYGRRDPLTWSNGSSCSNYLPVDPAIQEAEITRLSRRAIRGVRGVNGHLRLGGTGMVKKAASAFYDGWLSGWSGNRNQVTEFTQATYAQGWNDALRAQLRDRIMAFAPLTLFAVGCNVERLIAEPNKIESVLTSGRHANGASWIYGCDAYLTANDSVRLAVAHGAIALRNDAWLGTPTT